VGRNRPRITVVGLGPAGTDFLGDRVVSLMAGAARVFLRTARHPAADSIVGAEALDHLYEQADTFEDVYLSVVEHVVSAAVELAPAPVVYAVPGSPLIAERTVELLRTDSRVDVTVVPSLSFLDLAWERLGIDPLSAGVQLVDAERFAASAAGERGPFLVAQCWSQALLSEIKLSMIIEDGQPAPEAVLLHHLGLADEQIVRVSWWELDRTLAPDHLTSLYIPELPVPTDVEQEMARLEELVHTLRDRCPWDRAQTHGTLMPHLLEESYEVLDALQAIDEVSGETAIAAAPARHLQEELGDLLFQIVFHARLAEEEGHFTLADVARGVHDKLVHRHPHVFGDVDADTPEEVVTNWEAIKKEEKGRSSVTEGIPTNLPALLLSTKLQRKAISVGLDDPALAAGGPGLAEHLAHLCQAHHDPPTAAADAVLSGDDAGTERIVGELLFGVANLSRRLGIDPEHALRSIALTFKEKIVKSEASSQSGDPSIVP
jgi:tetrapyrrole methylase family protein / MazG family protein